MVSKQYQQQERRYDKRTLYIKSPGEQITQQEKQKRAHHDTLRGHYDFQRASRTFETTPQTVRHIRHTQQLTNTRYSVRTVISFAL